ncbi:TetR/AcrR family transcriptional regulator [Gordonia sp. OPL2]|uniref:TetR/AcrR family transcriptional regulator n=1 Tax=Gordonia sp. OPL2 TaxID=2486274 RepID=UPI001655525E|nr:TetR/AcrR family transcriptional regulator [Gordonia sp. OPL2]ROZ89313.1 TetR family transcriptional regulator [Gordonia sp. OPL2]
MGRWPTGSRDRLREAALSLFAERGYEGTSVADIAESAGVTERTFYRQFGDKREVLFDSEHTLEHAIVERLLACPLDMAPLDAIGRALDEAVGTFFADRLPSSRLRQTIIDANPELQEREALKMASLTDAVSKAFVSQGLDPTTASLTAEMGIAVFTIAFANWVSPGNTEPLAVLLRVAMTRLREVAATGGATSPDAHH